MGQLLRVFLLGFAEDYRLFNLLSQLMARLRSLYVCDSFWVNKSLPGVMEAVIDIYCGYWIVLTVCLSESELPFIYSAPNNLSVLSKTI